MNENMVRTSWWQRIKSSLLGVIFGLTIIVLNIKLLFWNESHNLLSLQSLIQLQQQVISVPPNPILTSNNQKPIYLTGVANTDDNLKDDLIGIDINAINLNRHVEMYQWQETSETNTKNELGGAEKETTTYNYQPIWSDFIINSSSFNEAITHQNPNNFAISSDNQYAPDVTLGDFKLSTDIITQIGHPDQILLTEDNVNKLTEQFNGPAKLNQNEIYLGNDPNLPQIGDIRIFITAIYPQKISIIGTQMNNTIVPFIGKNDEKILIVANGQKSSKQMIAEQISSNNLTAWGFRLVSLILFIIGFNLIFKPLIVLADFFPLLGSIGNIGASFISLILSLCMWGILTAIAWFYIRPAYSFGLLMLIGLALIGLFKRRKSKMN